MLDASERRFISPSASGYSLSANSPIWTVPPAEPEHFRTSHRSDVTSDRQPEMSASPASERTHGALLQSPTVPIDPIRPRRFTFSAKANQVNSCRVQVEHRRAEPTGSCTAAVLRMDFWPCRRAPARSSVRVRRSMCHAAKRGGPWLRLFMRAVFPTRP
jgi:hypothetical protein